MSIFSSLTLVLPSFLREALLREAFSPREPPAEPVDDGCEQFPPTEKSSSSSHSSGSDSPPPLETLATPMSTHQESTLIEPSRSTSPDAPPFGDSFNLNHSLQISSPPLDSPSSRDTSFHVPSLVVMRDVLDTPSSLSSPPVFDTRGFEYTSAKEITVFKWAFETIQNNLVSSGLVIEPRDRPLDFQVVDILA